MTALKTALFIFFVPGTVIIAIPLGIILPGDRALIDPGLLRWLAIPLWLGGSAVLLWCAVDFVRQGRGTPAPVEAPKALVVGGLYRYVRNPMYVGVLAATAGHVFWFGSLRIAGYVLALWLIFHLFVSVYEEPHLRKTFGAAYERYCKSVPRWIPKLNG
jgi:protein-S-isoprenylcysteine O-methyltransferase Ste14